MATPTATADAAQAQAQKPKPQFDANKALKRAMGGGIAGASAMAIQVRALARWWGRYGNGASMKTALTTLYKEGGLLRFYRGYLPALIQGPVSRFAANAGALAFLEGSERTENWPVALKTVFASAAAASFRIFLTPVDTVKTTMQVVGKDGLQVLGTKIRTIGPQVLWYGAIASSVATFVGHYPWCDFTFNYLDATLPKYKDDLPKRLGRNAFIGFVASAASDTLSNSIRVIKTYKQASAEQITYPNAVRAVVAKDGWVGLFGRGLSTRIVANGMQGLLFSVLWKCELIH
ncbi:mitochondrial carrier [Gonapodya prolifera JEL478]|uniref:Mitochondrial carrier n=1 Tax=Gonapodya prolifera (strain JEL478) TaxID=1344416 RepID=A0A139AX95_GONPJ|nr:mitochondrial carrier [Gonapodya prolifera JEL478]|eukprot:KXS21371.1 mitochondrial carrier [Gonapodya prolifera JEL478]